MNQLRIGLLWGALLLSGVTQAQTPSPAQLGLVIATPNVVQVLDSSKHWSTIGTVDATTHVFTVSGAAGIPEAPTGSGVLYGRKNSAWSTVVHTDITDWTATLTPYALLASPTFTGTPSLPTGATGVTQSPGDSSTKIATTAFVGAAVTASAYTLPTASPTVLGGVKVDNSTITIAGGVISSGGGTITAGTTPTSGFAAGNVLKSDGTKVQAVADNCTSWGANPTYPIYLCGRSSYPSSIMVNATGSNSTGIGLNAYNYSNGGGITINDGTDTAGYYSWIHTTNDIGTPGDTLLRSPAIDIIVDGQSTRPQAFRVYNTWTDDSNGEWGAFDWATVANTLTIGAQKNGTGIVRPVNIVGSSISENGLGLPTSLTSGGVLYASSASQIASSAVLTNNAVMIGKGAGVAPTTTTTPTASAFISNGTKPTLTTGTCSGSSGAGGATAGTFVLVGICAAAGTVILTALPTATTGYACDMEDRVTRAATIVQSAATTTSATFIMGSTPSVANDVFQFKCVGY